LKPRHKSPAHFERGFCAD